MTAARTRSSGARSTRPSTVTGPDARPAVTAVPDRPALRLVRPPDPDPPERPSSHDRGPTATAGAGPEHVQGTLALLFTLPGGLPATPVHPFAPVRRADPTPDPASRPPAPAEAVLPDPRRWVARLVQAAVEVREGDRPAGQLLRWLTRDVHEQLCREVDARPRLHRRGRPTRAVLRSVRITGPTPGAIEACAVVDTPERARAVALRLEERDGRWVCTALAVL